MASLQKNHWVWGYVLMAGASHHSPPLAQIQALSQSQLFYSFDKDLLSTYYMPGIVGSIGFTLVSKRALLLP